MKYVNNDSGHYKPEWTDEEGKKLVIRLFKEEFGIDITDKFIKYNEK